jgi:hypothetical protein
MISWVQHYQEVRLFKLELEEWLGDATLVTASTTLEPSGPNISQTQTDTVVNILVGPGIPQEGNKCTVCCLCIASDGRQREFWGTAQFIADIPGVT